LYRCLSCLVIAISVQTMVDAVLESLLKLEQDLNIWFTFFLFVLLKIIAICIKIASLLTWSVFIRIVDLPTKDLRCKQI